MPQVASGIIFLPIGDRQITQFDFGYFLRLERQNFYFDKMHLYQSHLSNQKVS